MGVIMTYLGDSSVFWQIVNAAVTHVAKINPVGSDPAKAQRRPHASKFFITKTHVGKLGMNLMK